MARLFSDTLVTIIGGSGFVGRHVVRALARRGYRLKVAVRRPDLAGHLQPLGRSGQIVPVQANVRYPASLAAACEGAEAVINLVGILYGRGAQSFDAVHVFGAEASAKAAKAAKARTFIQMSALGRADTKSVGILTSTVLILVIVLGGSVLVRVVVGWFEAFRGASAKSCASAMLLVDSTPTRTIKSVISRETGEHFII